MVIGSILVLAGHMAAFVAEPVLTPEPGSAILIGIGLVVGAGVARWRTRK